MNPIVEETPVPAPPPATADVKAMEHVIPTRNQPALMGYYYSIFALIPIAGLFLAPAAISYGLLGMDRGNRLPSNIGYGHALFATVTGIIGAILNYGMVAALAITLTFSYMNQTWPFLPEENQIRNALEDQQLQINELRQHLDALPKPRALPGRNVQ